MFVGVSVSPPTFWRYCGRKALNRGYPIPIVAQQNQTRHALRNISRVYDIDQAPLRLKPKQQDEDSVRIPSRERTATSTSKNFRLTHSPKLWGNKKGCNSFRREFGEDSSDHFFPGEPSIRGCYIAASELVQYLFRQPSLPSIFVGNAIDTGYRFGLTPSAQQELWRLIKMEKEESAYEHGEGKSAESEHEVSPAHILILVEAGNARGCDVARCL